MFVCFLPSSNFQDTIACSNCNRLSCKRSKSGLPPKLWVAVVHDYLSFSFFLIGSTHSYHHSIPQAHYSFAALQVGHESCPQPPVLGRPPLTPALPSQQQRPLVWTPYFLPAAPAPPPAPPPCSCAPRMEPKYAVSFSSNRVPATSVCILYSGFPSTKGTKMSRYTRLSAGLRSPAAPSLVVTKRYPVGDSNLKGAGRGVSAAGCSDGRGV